MLPSARLSKEFPLVGTYPLQETGKNALSGLKHPQSIAVKLDNYTLIKVYFKGWMHSSFSYS